MKSLYLVGGGGHCGSCLDVIESEAKYKVEGIFDLPENVGQSQLGYQVIGTDSDIHHYVRGDVYFLITIGQIKNPEPRIKAYNLLKSLNANLASIVSPRAYVARSATLGQGVIVMHDALINVKCVVGNNCIMNSKSLLEHDVRVSDHCHVSTGAIINGAATIEEACFVGSNATVKQACLVKKGSIVPAGVFFKSSTS